MKISPLLAGIAGIALVALTATTLYAQAVSGASVINKMKAAAGAFTLAGDLNPGQTGLESSPVSGKKTGGMLTAGEWNRVLELVDQIGSLNIYTGELWKCTCGGYMHMVTTQNLTFGETCVFGNGGTATNVQYASWSCTKLQSSATPAETVLPPAPTGFTYTCPTGFIDTGATPGQEYQSCVEKDISPGTKTYNEARIICAQKGGDLCNMAEWQEACENNVLNVLTSKAEWIDSDNYVLNKWVALSGAPTASLTSHLDSVSAAIRTCGYARLQGDFQMSSGFKHSDINFRCCASKALIGN